MQIGLNAVAILGGSVGEDALSPGLTRLAGHLLEAGTAQTVGFVAPFLIITTAFILFADLVPKRIGLNKTRRPWRSS